MLVFNWAIWGCAGKCENAPRKASNSGGSGVPSGVSKQLLTSASRSQMNFFAYPNNRGVGGRPTNVADEKRRTSTASWPSYGYQQYANNNAYLAVDTRLPHVVTKVAVCGCE